MAENLQTTSDNELKTRASTLAKDASNELVNRANETGSRGMSSLGDKIDEAAAKLEAKAAGQDTVPPEKVAVVSERLHEAASYLRDSDPKGMLTDLDGAIQRHPYRAMAVGAAIGWVFGRLMSRD